MLHYTFAVLIVLTYHWTDVCSQYESKSASQEASEVDLPEFYSQEEIVKHLVDNGIVKSDIVRDILLRVDRKKYLKFYPYEIYPVNVGYGATFSPPQTHAIVLETLKDHLKEGKRVLDIGCGSGYLTVCMALLVGKTGFVVGLDHMVGLTEYAIDNVKADRPKLFQEGRINFTVGDGRVGCPEQGPYDVIYVGAVAITMPMPLLDQLKPGGRLVIAINKFAKRKYTSVLTAYDKHPNGTITKSERKELFEENVTDFLLDKKIQFMTSSEEIPQSTTNKMEAFW